MKLLYIIGQQGYDEIYQTLKARFEKSIDISCIMWLSEFDSYLTQGNSFDRCVILNPKRTIQNYHIDYLGDTVEKFKRILLNRNLIVGQDVIFCVSDEEEGEILVERTCDMQGTVLIPEIQAFKSSDLAALSIKDFGTLRSKYKCHSLSSLRLQQNRNAIAMEQAEEGEIEEEREQNERFIGSVQGLEDDSADDNYDSFDVDMSSLFSGALLEESYTGDGEYGEDEQDGERTERLTDDFSEVDGTTLGSQGFDGTQGILDVSDGGFASYEDVEEEESYEGEVWDTENTEENFDLSGAIQSQLSGGFSDYEAETEDSDDTKEEAEQPEETGDGQTDFFADSGFWGNAVEPDISEPEETEMEQDSLSEEHEEESTIDEYEFDETEDSTPVEQATAVETEEVAETTQENKGRKGKFSLGFNKKTQPTVNVQIPSTPVQQVSSKPTKGNKKQEDSVNTLFDKPVTESGESISSKALKSGKLNAKAKVKKKADNQVGLETLLKERKAKSTIMVFTGSDGTGKTLVSANVANLLCRMGRSVLMIDLDTIGKGQSYINSTCFDLIHGVDPCANKVINALNGTETALYKNLDIVRPGYHILTSTIGSDSKSIKEQVHERSYYSFLYTLRSEYDFIIADVGIRDLTTTFKEFADSADYIFTLVEATTHGVMDFLLSYTNIDNEIAQSMMYKRSKVILNKEDSFKSFCGRKVEDTLSLLSSLDDMVKLITGIADSQNSFADIDICSIIPYNSEFEQFWGTAKFISDTEAGEKLFSDLLQECLS